MIRPSTPSDFQHCTSGALPEAWTSSRWKSDVVLRRARGGRPACPLHASPSSSLLELRHVARETLGGELGRELLERGADRVDLDQLVVAEDSDTGAAERLGLDQAEQLEVAQRLPYRRLARPELLRDPGLDEPLARLAALR